uniref:Putative secreted protein n=1 Tax=Anopheles darlingi TaxID=43151 RepID=A0A2M4D1I6_ANODA
MESLSKLSTIAGLIVLLVKLGAPVLAAARPVVARAFVAPFGPDSGIIGTTPGARWPGKFGTFGMVHPNGPMEPAPAAPSQIILLSAILVSPTISRCICFHNSRCPCSLSPP